MGALAKLVSLVAGSSIEHARDTYATAGTELREAEDAYALEPTDPAYRRVVTAREKADKARLLLAAAERRDNERRAAEAAEQRQKLLAEHAELCASLTREAIEAEAAPLMERLVAMVGEAKAIAEALHTGDRAARDRLLRLRELSVELGQPHDLTGIAEKAADEGACSNYAHHEAHTRAALAYLRGPDSPAINFARQVWRAIP